MKTGQIIFFIIIYMIFIMPEIYSFAANTSYKPNCFTIMFWDTNINRNPEILEEIKGLTYSQFIENKKIKIRANLTDDYIIKYHWDDQLLEIDQAKWEKDRMETDEEGTGFHSYFFTIVLNEKIIYHGIARIGQTSVWLVREPIRKILLKYDRSNYPSITVIGIINEGAISVLALKPRLGNGIYTREFDEKEQKKILNDDVLEYFKKQGKIVRGKLDLDKHFGIRRIDVKPGLPENADQ